MSFWACIVHTFERVTRLDVAGVLYGGQVCSNPLGIAVDISLFLPLLSFFLYIWPGQAMSFLNKYIYIYNICTSFRHVP